MTLSSFIFISGHVSAQPDERTVNSSNAAMEKTNDTKNKTTIKKAEYGYILTLPDQITSKIKEREYVELTIRRIKGDTSVQGRLVEANDGLLLETQETLDLPLDASKFDIILHEPGTPAASCLAAEFGIGCFFAGPCAGTRYCLPGHGPGGFTCQCL